MINTTPTNANKDERTQRLARILEKMKGRPVVNAIGRVAYDITADESLSIVEQTGLMRTPGFTIDGENRFAYENIFRWANGDKTAKALHPQTRQVIPANMKAGIYIAGNTGTGKTWCLELLREYLVATGFKIIINGDERQFLFANLRADEITTSFAQNGDLSRFVDMDILAIQDVGTEPRETLYMGNRVEVIRAILERRGDAHDKITLITSNIPFMHDLFAERYGDRVVSRLREMVNYYEIKGRDRREH